MCQHLSNRKRTHAALICCLSLCSDCHSRASLGIRVTHLLLRYYFKYRNIVCNIVACYCIYVLMSMKSWSRIKLWVIWWSCFIWDSSWLFNELYSFRLIVQWHLIFNAIKFHVLINPCNHGPLSAWRRCTVNEPERDEIPAHKSREN